MNATFIVATAATYGGDRVIGRYARGLRDRGHEARVVSVGPVASRAFYGDVPVRSLGLDGFPSSRLDYLRAATRAVRAIDDPEVLVATWTPTLPVAWAVEVLRRAGRVVWLAQDYPEMFVGLPFELGLLRRGVWMADAVVAVSDACARFHGRARRPERFHVIHSGLEPAFFDAPSADDPQGILFVGAPIERKGWPEFVDAMKLLADADVVTEVTLVSGTEPARRPPGGLERRSGLSDREMAELYATHRVYVCASRAEGWGLPALEAMAAGTPVVTTLHEGCRAYARPGENCLGVPTEDPEALSRAIRRALADEDLRGRLVRGGRSTAGAFTWDGALDRFEAALHG